MVGKYYETHYSWIYCYHLNIAIYICKNNFKYNLEYRPKDVWSLLCYASDLEIPFYIKLKVHECINDPLFELEVKKLLKGNL